MDEECTGRPGLRSGPVVPKPHPVELPSGQVVGVYEYGAADGRPVMVFHGTPACGAGFDWDDYRALSGGWGVDFAAISVPVRIFQGTADTMVPPRHSEALAARIPNAVLVTWPEEGHLGTINHVHEILDWLASLPWDGA